MRDFPICKVLTLRGLTVSFQRFELQTMRVIFLSVYEIAKTSSFFLFALNCHQELVKI